jgi:CubicO group peptidase (beta-lactamase class C family)
VILAERVKFLGERLGEYIEEGVIPGATFGLVTPSEATFGFGGNAQIVPDVEEMRGDSIFDVASLTKVVATLPSILILQENGEIRLDNTVKLFLPDFSHEDTTILQLLTHTSGLPGMVKFYKTCRNKNEILTALKKTELAYEPGTKVLYSDLNFMLLGFIVERVAESIDVFSEKCVFHPLEMYDTCFNPTGEKKNRCVSTEVQDSRGGTIKGVVHDGNAYAMGGICGHAGLFTTVYDLAKFASMVLNDGSSGSRQVLSASSINVMSRCWTEEMNERRGLGWMLKNEGGPMGDLASNNCLFHTGFTGTSILIDREYEMALILLTNRIHPTRNNVKFLEARGYINNIAETSVSYGKR